MLILSTGRVEQRLVELDQAVTDDDLADVRTTVHRAVIGETIAGALTALRALEARRSAVPRSVVATLVEAMSDHRSDERVVVGGTANLARYGDSFDVDVRPLLEALEEHVVLLKLLGEAHSGGVLVRIGHEGPYEELVVDQRRVHRLRPRRRGAGQPGHRGPDPDGLPRHDGRGARRGPLRLAHPRRGVRSPRPSLRSSHLNNRELQKDCW